LANAALRCLHDDDAHRLRRERKRDRAGHTWSVALRASGTCAHMEALGTAPAAAAWRHWRQRVRRCWRRQRWRTWQQRRRPWAGKSRQLLPPRHGAASRWRRRRRRNQRGSRRHASAAENPPEVVHKAAMQVLVCVHYLRVRLLARECL
jgi:hypothetical protein